MIRGRVKEYNTVTGKKSKAASESGSRKLSTSIADLDSESVQDRGQRSEDRENPTRSANSHTISRSHG